MTSTGTIASAQLWLADGLQLPRRPPSDRLLAGRLIVSKQPRLAERGRSASGMQAPEADAGCSRVLHPCA